MQGKQLSQQAQIQLLKDRQKEGRQRSLFAFLLPVLILFLAFGMQGVFPFGDRHILTVDLYHQYAPFLHELQTKLLAGESLFFSWSAGLGINFYSLLANYLSSPLNLLCLIFPERLLSELVLVLVLLKVGLAGYCFRHFLLKYYHRDGPLALGFATAYALSGFVLANFFNIMWLDALYLLPLLALAMLYLIRDQIYAFYIGTLALTLISNYYAAFFICLFLFLYFFIMLEKENLKGFRPNFRIFLKVALSTVIGFGLSAIVTLPTIYALKLTSAAGDVFPETFEMYNPGIDFLSRLLPFASVSIRSGMANIYVGSFILLLLGVFLSGRALPKRRKFCHVALLLFLFFSLNNNVLNFIWHGLHYPNQLPFRNSFVMSFLLLTMGYEALAYVKSVDRRFFRTYIAVIIPMLMLLRKIDADSYSPLMVTTSVALLVTYAWLFIKFIPQPRYRLQPLRKRALYRKQLSYILLALMINELAVNTFVAINRVEDAEYFGLREPYYAGEEVAEMRQKIEELKAQHAPDLVRMEIKPDKSVNDAMLYRSNGFTIFSSTYPEKNVKAMKTYGYPNNGINSFQYCGSTPVMNALLGIRYLIQREEKGITDHYMEPVYDQEGLTILEYREHLPVAYLSHYPLTDQEATSTPPVLANPFDQQARLFYRLTGSHDSRSLFLLAELEEQESARHNVQVTRQVDAYKITRNDNYDADLSFRLPIEIDGNYYLTWEMSGLRIDSVKASYGDVDTSVGRKNQNVTELGYHEAGEEVTIKVDLKGQDDMNKTGTLKITAARLDDDVFMEGLSRLKGKSEVLDHDAHSLHVKTQSEEPQSLFFATTYDPGWHCQVDGEERPLEPVEGLFMGVPLEAGEHEVVLTFIPQAFPIAWKISLIALIITLLFAVLDWREARQRKLSRTQSTEENAESRLLVKATVAPDDSTKG